MQPTYYSGKVTIIYLNFEHNFTCFLRGKIIKILIKWGLEAKSEFRVETGWILGGNYIPNFEHLSESNRV